MLDDLLQRLGVRGGQLAVSGDSSHSPAGREELVSYNPATGQALASVRMASRANYEQVVQTAAGQFADWRMRPAPQRGEVVRQLGQLLRRHKADLGRLVTLECGKILSEGLGEVQEMIDICDFAVGLSRQLYGLTMPSERPRHRLFEQWHPLGTIGIVSAFNFPVAVWAWNAAIAAVCGDTMIWKPSPETPLVSLAVQKICDQVMVQNDCLGVFNLCLGSVEEVGEPMIADRRLPLISATGSCPMGRRVGSVVAGRLGRSILELGGNNGLIVTESANLDLALRAIVFAAVGTAGQRCTSLRRLIVHASKIEELSRRLAAAFKSVTIGDPSQEGVLMGPLINERAVEAMQRALQQAVEQGGEIVFGGGRLERAGNFVEPALVRATSQMEILREETFAPILYLLPYRELDEAIALHNAVDQGLSSAIFTDSLLAAEQFLSAAGSDCGIANVNIGTSGAEIGGAFGGEKDTGGGRESGSDAWKAYMRRQTCTINGGRELPLAQGVRFDLGG
ncbi:MAG: aldehyde dehydrogenase family protein [Pirellulales bacterium]